MYHSYRNSKNLNKTIPRTLKKNYMYLEYKKTQWIIYVFSGYPSPNYLQSILNKIEFYLLLLFFKLNITLCFWFNLLSD